MIKISNYNCTSKTLEWLIYIQQLYTLNLILKKQLIQMHLLITLEVYLKSDIHFILKTISCFLTAITWQYRIYFYITAPAFSSIVQWVGLPTPVQSENGHFTFPLFFYFCDGCTMNFSLIKITKICYLKWFMIHKNIVVNKINK